MASGRPSAFIPFRFCKPLKHVIWEFQPLPLVGISLVLVLQQTFLTYRPALCIAPGSVCFLNSRIANTLFPGSRRCLGFRINPEGQIEVAPQ